MVDILDDDEANSFAKSMLKDHLKLLEAKKEAASDVSRLTLNEYSIDDLTEIAFRNVAALNAGGCPGFCVNGCWFNPEPCGLRTEW